MVDGFGAHHFNFEGVAWPISISLGLTANGGPKLSSSYLGPIVTCPSLLLPVQSSGNYSNQDYVLAFSFGYLASSSCAHDRSSEIAPLKI